MSVALPFAPRENHQRVTNFVSVVFTPVLSDEQKQEFGLVERIPTTLKEALEALKKDEQWAKAFLGATMYEWHLTLREHEEQAEGKKDPVERRMAMLELF